MPSFDKDELQALIASGGVGAVSVDTSVFDRYGRNLTSQPLLGLRQFGPGGKQFVLSDVVVREVKNHLTLHAAEALNKLGTTLRDVQTHWHREIDSGVIEGSLGLNQSPLEFAARYLDAYLEVTGAAIISSDGRVTHEEVLHRYFGSEPPFSSSKGKKNEFPDALALLSLEDWAKRAITKMLVISQDNDWRAFCDRSPWLICEEQLDQALSYFHQDSGFVVARVVAMLGACKAPGTAEVIEQAVLQYLEQFEPEIEATAAAEYEVDVIEPVLQGWGLDQVFGPKVLESDNETVVFSTMVDVNAGFEGTFRFEVWDGVDKEYVYLGSGTKRIEQSISMQLIITMSRQIDPEPDIYRIDIPPIHVVLNFQEIEPD